MKYPYSRIPKILSFLLQMSECAYTVFKKSLSDKCMVPIHVSKAKAD